MIFGIIIAAFVIFCGAYFYLSSTFIKRQAALSFLNMSDVVATEVNTQVNSDYDLFKEGTDKLLEAMGGEITDAKIAAVGDANAYYSLHHVSEFKIAYAMGSDFVIEGTHYAIDTENNKQFNYVNEVAAYKFSNLLVNNEDATTYFCYRYKDVVMYFDAASFLTKIMNTVSDMPETKKFFIMEDNANILLYEGKAETNKKIYNIITSGKSFNYAGFKYQMKSVADDLQNARSGYCIIEVEDEATFLVYSPVFKEILENPLFVGYTLSYNDAIRNNTYKSVANYLLYSLIVVFSSILIILATTLYLAARRYTIREQDFALAKISQFYAKPYALTVKKNGEIISKNKTFRTDIENFREFHTVDDFNIYNMEEVTVLAYVKGQKSFIVLFENSEGHTHYARFISVKSGNRFILVGEDCTKEVLENEKNKQVAMFNAVTGLPNKLVFDQDVNDLCNFGSLLVSNNSVIALDILDFVKINRLFGYTAADNMLRQMAARMAELLSEFRATIYNIRTSLFIVVVRNVENYGLMLSWIKNAITKLEDPIEIKKGYFTSVEIRMGLFNIEADQMEVLDAQHIYECAITALDRSKATRLTKFSVYSNDFGKSLTRDQIMEQDLAKAIVNHEFKMFFQPQFNTKIKRIVGFEALIRWDNPKYSLDSPEHFITIAEKNGMITEIGRFVIDETFSFAKRIENTGIHISMNVSPVQLLQSGFVNELIDAFEDHDLKPGSIAVEITETFLMENSDVVISKLKLLREAGFSIHLDDFGVGYSSMLYLKDLPVDTIKIDKEFIKHMLSDKFSRVIVTKIVQIAVNLGLSVIAEGVELERQAEILLKAGCRVIQGFLISKAVPDEQAIELIKKYLGDEDLESSDVSRFNEKESINAADLELLTDVEEKPKERK